MKLKTQDGYGTALYLPLPSPLSPFRPRLTPTLPSRSDIKRSTESWKAKYGWRAQEEEMNRLPHFISKIPVDGYGDIDIDIHFLCQESSFPHSIPLLFVHGWSRSFLEEGRTLPLLQGEIDMEEYGERGLLLGREALEDC
jgi:hypothetical protein